MTIFGQAKVWYLHEDTELHIVHSSTSCPDAKIAVKYQYLKSVTLKTPEDAEALDKRARACVRCVKNETAAVKKSERSRKRHIPPPGFRGG